MSLPTTVTTQTNTNTGMDAIPKDQIIPDNFGKSGAGGRKTAKQTTVAQNPSVKNPQAPKVEMRDKDSREFGLKEANGLVSKFMQQLSVATTEVPAAGQGIQQLTNFIKKLDGQNTSGASLPALQILDQLVKQGVHNPLGSIPGILGGGMMSQLQSFITQLVQQNKQANQNQPPQIPQCPNNYVWSANLQTCVLNSNTSSFLTS